MRNLRAGERKNERYDRQRNPHPAEGGKTGGHRRTCKAAVRQPLHRAAQTCRPAGKGARHAHTRRRKDQRRIRFFSEFHLPFASELLGKEKDRPFGDQTYQ